MSKTGHSLIKEMITSENADIAGEMSDIYFININIMVMMMQSMHH